eukprot:COSAG01_NODE_521_length_15963_cov_76.378530_5_plen_96_part_00
MNAASACIRAIGAWTTCCWQSAGVLQVLPRPNVLRLIPAIRAVTQEILGKMLVNMGFASGLHFGAAMAAAVPPSSLSGALPLVFRLPLTEARTAV